MHRLGMILGVITLVLGLGLGTNLNRPVPLAHAAGWFYQVGTSPDLGGNPPTHIYSLFHYDPSQTVFPPGDTTYSSSLWNSGLDAAYTGNFFQVGYAVNASIYSNQHELFIQTTAPLDPTDHSYLWCESGWGFSSSIGANGQAGGGCDATVENTGLGLVSGNNYWFEIYQSQGCAWGSQGCTYGCNGNTALPSTATRLVTWLTVPHMAG